MPTSRFLALSSDASGTGPCKRQDPGLDGALVSSDMAILVHLSAKSPCH